MPAMMSFISELWAFLRGRKDHPIVAHELGGWSYMKLWRALQRGCLPLMLLALLIPGGGCGLLMLFSLADSASAPGDWLLVPAAVLIGILAAGEIIRWLASLLLTAMTSTTLSAEVEAQTLALLRVSPLPATEIVLAKFGAAMRQFRLPALVSMAARAVFLLGMALVAALALLDLSGGALTAPRPADLLNLRIPVVPSVTLINASAALGLLAVAGLSWLAYYVLGPALNLLFFGAVGMFASSLARTRATGLMSAVGVRIGVWMASYVGGQIVSTVVSLLAIPLTLGVTGPALPPFDPLLAVVGVALAALAWIALMVAVQLGGALLLLRSAAARLDRTV